VRREVEVEGHGLAPRTVRRGAEDDAGSLAPKARGSTRAPRAGRSSARGRSRGSSSRPCTPRAPVALDPVGERSRMKRVTLPQRSVRLLGGGPNTAFQLGRAPSAPARRARRRSARPPAASSHEVIAAELARVGAVRAPFCYVGDVSLGTEGAGTKGLPAGFSATRTPARPRPGFVTGDRPPAGGNARRGRGRGRAAKQSARQRGEIGRQQPARGSTARPVWPQVGTKSPSTGRTGRKERRAQPVAASRTTSARPRRAPREPPRPNFSQSQVRLCAGRSPKPGP
jgi:hypothetical protein